MVVAVRGSKWRILMLCSAGGAVEAALGNLTGNTNLQSQGEQYKQSGIAELKSYQEQNPPTGHEGTTGKIEQTIGSAVGCEGMVNDAQGSTTSSSTATGTAGTTGPSGTINPGDNVAPAHLGGTGQPGFGVSTVDLFATAVITGSTKTDSSDLEQTGGASAGARIHKCTQAAKL